MAKVVREKPSRMAKYEKCESNTRVKNDGGLIRRTASLKELLLENAFGSVSFSGFGNCTLTTAQRMILRKASCETENEQVAEELPQQIGEANTSK